MGLTNADHEESSPDAPLKLITKLSCSLAGEKRDVSFVPGSQAYQIYAQDRAIEIFACSYGLNKSFQEQIGSRDLRMSGFDDDGTVRVVELPGHPFYISTLFVPQMRSAPGAPHPLISAYVREAFEFSKNRS